MTSLSRADITIYRSRYFATERSTQFPLTRYSLSESVSTRKRKLEDEVDEESEDEGEVDVKATKNDKAQVQTQKWDKRLGRKLGFKITLKS